MATKKPALPEISIDGSNTNNTNHQAMIQTAEIILKTRAELAKLETKEDNGKKHLANCAESERNVNIENDKYIGLIRVVNKEQVPIRIEFRQNNGALDVSQEPVVDSLFGPSRPLLWGRDKVITEVLDPQKVIDDLKAAGKNPWDFIEIRVKADQDRIVSESTDAVVSAEALLPKKGFLTTLNDIVHTLSVDAKAFVKEYLDKTLKPTVVVGTKGKA